MNDSLLSVSQIARAKKNASIEGYPPNDLGVTLSDYSMVKEQDRVTKEWCIEDLRSTLIANLPHCNISLANAMIKLMDRWHK